LNYRIITYYFVVLLIFIQGLQAFGQVPTRIYPKIIDSLYKQLPAAKATARVDVLNGLALYLAPRYYDSSNRYANEALKLAEKLDYTKGKGIAFFNIGNIYYFKLDAKKSMMYYLDALRILEDMEPSQELGNLYYQIANFNDGSGNCRKAISVFKTVHNRASEDFVRMQMLILRSDMTYDSVIILGKKYLEDFKKEGNIQGTYTTLMQLANACFYQNIPSGLEYANEALKLSEKTGDDWLIANALHKVVNYHKNIRKEKVFKTNAVLAETLLQRARDILEKSKLPYRNRLLSETYREIGELRWEAGDLETAKHYFELDIAAVGNFLKSMDTITFPEYESKYGWYTSDHQSMAMCYGELSTINALQGNYKKALEYQLKGDSLYNRVMGILSDQAINIMQARYEDQRKRNQIDQIQKEKEIQRARQSHAIMRYSLMGGAIIIMLLVILFFLQRKRFESNRKALVLEQKLLRSQMNPHFLFNALTGIQNFIVTQKPDKASIYLSKFANLVRNILDNSVDEYVKLEKEISAIENYLELQKIRYAGKFDYRIEIDDDIDPEVVMIPPMLAQPFIENSIEHGIRHKETSGHIDIRFTLKDGTLLFEVEDNGIGRDKAREIGILRDPAHRSMATSLTLERLANLNHKLQKKIILEITDLKNALGEAAGTKVMFGIPLGQ